jgi:hypothetical protein
MPVWKVVDSDRDEGKCCIGGDTETIKLARNVHADKEAHNYNFEVELPHF